MRYKIGVVGEGGEWSGLPVVRELGKLNNEIFAFFSDSNSITLESKFISDFTAIPGVQAGGKINKKLLYLLLSEFKKKSITHVISLDEQINLLLMRNRLKLGNIRVALPPTESAEIAIEKSKSSKFVKGLGIPVPRTFYFKNSDEIRASRHKFTSLHVVKGTRGTGASLVRYARNKDKVLEYYEEIFSKEKVNNFATEKPIVQQYFGGPTYLTHAMAENGKVKVVIPQYKFREWPITGGTSTRVKTIKEPRLVSHMTKILESLKWHGPAGAEWKYDPKKQDFVFIEMSPRFEGSIDLGVKAGVNLPKLHLDLMNSKKIPDEMKYQLNIHYRWFWRADFKNFFHNPYGFLNLIKEAINPKINGELTFSDINPIKKFWKAPFLQLKDFISGRLPPPPEDWPRTTDNFYDSN